MGCWLYLFFTSSGSPASTHCPSMNNLYSMAAPPWMRYSDSCQFITHYPEDLPNRNSLSDSIDISGILDILIIHYKGCQLSRFDSLDKEIIFYLNRNARMPSAQIARQLGVSERTVNHRIKRLVDSGVIQPVAVANPNSFGYTLAVDILCELEVGYQSLVIQAILEIPEVSYMAISTGDQH